jgi:hypothetical protein
LFGPRRARRLKSVDFDVNVELGEPRVIGVNSQHSGLLDLEIPLLPKPDDDWSQIFNGMPPGVSFAPSMYPLQVRGGTVYMTPPDDEIEIYVEQAKALVHGTNTYYNANVAPKLKQIQDEREAEAADRKRRVEEATEKLKKKD